MILATEGWKSASSSSQLVPTLLMRSWRSAENMERVWEWTRPNDERPHAEIRRRPRT